MDGNPKPKALGDLLKGIVKKARPAQKALKGRRLAQSILEQKMPQYSGRLAVASVKSGVVTLDADSAALFQEIEGFHRQPIIDMLRGAGLKVREVRVRLASDTR
jgi:hypothetical protein